MKIISIKKIFTGLPLVVILLLSHCTSPKNKEEVTETKKLKQEVIAVHDSAMGRMEDIMKLKSQLQAKADTTDTTTRQKITLSIQNLEAGNKAMMDWMHNLRVPLMENEAIGQPADTMSMENEVSYLRSEKVKIQKIDRQMENAIDSAKDILQQ